MLKALRHKRILNVALFVVVCLFMVCWGVVVAQAEEVEAEEVQEEEVQGQDTQVLDEVSVVRIYGETRFETAVEISRKGWQTAETVMVARGDQFADALTGAPLAYYYNAPILLVMPNQLPEVTKAEIERLKAKKIIVLGGEAAISKQVEEALEEINGVEDVIRIGGDDRYKTALQVAAHLPSSDKAVLAYGLNFPDALSIAPYAARKGMPIVLSDGTSLDEETRAFLLKHTGVYVIGGTAVISQDVAVQLKQSGLAVSRLGGENRYHTAVKIVEKFDQEKSRFVVSTGEHFADALTGSVLAAKNKMFLLLTPSDRIAPELTQFRVTYQPKEYLVLGGTQAVSASVVSSLKGIEPPGLFKIFLDPGHGGSDPGALGNGFQEKELTLDIALRIRQVLLSEYKNVEVMLSRDKDVYVALDTRAAMANNWGADYFVSVHHNAGGGRGFESYIYNKTTNPTTIHAQQVIHDHVAKGLAEKYGVRDRGKKSANFAVLRGSKMPAILFENLFVDNAEDAKLLKSTQFRQDLARLIAEGIGQAFNLAKK
jgi:N-acetylmuramoyl-L-alanine amidase